jgi:hypothetical protein
MTIRHYDPSVRTQTPTICNGRHYFVNVDQRPETPPEWFCVQCGGVKA